MESDPALAQLLASVDDGGGSGEPDILDDVLGEGATAGPLNGLLSFLAQKRPEETIVLDGAGPVAAQSILETVQSAITAAADEAEEDQRDQTAISTPLTRADKAITELQRALAALPKARSFADFDEDAMRERIAEVQKLVDEYGDGA